MRPTLAKRGLLFATLLPALVVVLAAPGRAGRAGDGRRGIEFFENKVRPVLVEHCYRCHSTSAKKLKGELKLDSRAAALQGGENGPALVPGHPEKSRLIRALRYKDVDLQMPPAGKLPDPVIADLAAWIKMGAVWPDEKNPDKAVSPSRATFDLQKRKREHWSWQPIQAPRPKTVKGMAWPRTPSDRFILARLEEKGLKPAPEADRRTLIRRVFFDLVGLPPAPADVDAFLADKSPDALASLVDRLLASPRFGERWGRHWLDLVRYAESRGHEFDYSTPNAHQYRDYVIRAINADVPYNGFVTEHVAGDLVPAPRLNPSDGSDESIIGTGFWFLGEELHSPVDICQDQADRFDNRIDVLGKAFLGLTIACARCHDHKFDAISTKDYYALFGFLKSSSYRLARFDALDHNRGVARRIQEARARARPPIQRAFAEALRPGTLRLADYLLAARAVMQAEAKRSQNLAAGKIASAKSPPPLAEVARQYKVDQSRLSLWVRQLTAAAKDPADPFHLWARSALDPGSESPKRFTDMVRVTLATWRERDSLAARGRDAGVIVDYSSPKPGSWLTDGLAFGPGPVRPGDIRFSNDPSRPIAKLLDYFAAEKDPAWNDIKAAPGSENDPGALGAAARSGRTLLTPSFKITTGKVFYLVKGAGLAYAAVDSHAMIAGPLHAQLVRPIEARNEFHWVLHDLTMYKGLDARLEFTATGAGDFAVAKVVQADGPAGQLYERPNPLLVKMLEDTNSISAAGLAKGYQRLVTRTLSRLAEDRVVGSKQALAHSRIARWLVERPDLFVRAEGLAARVRPAAAPHFAELARLTSEIKNESRLALAMLDGDGVDEQVFIRGSHKAPGEKAGRRFLEALSGPEPLTIMRGSGRLELARQMTDPAIDPFLPRVVANRVWHHLFGRGIVSSVDNFGVLGEAPTHPELLDHLATRLVDHGWSVKKLIRELVLSSSYRMSSAPAATSTEDRMASARADAVDPQNLLLHRARIRRLEGEAIRDAMLALSGRLDSRMYGPAVPIHLTPFLEGRGRPASGPLDGAGRRSVYIAVRRNFLSPMMLAFDTPIPFSTVGKRTVSNVPAQALILMNDPSVHQQVRRWADCVRARQASRAASIIEMYQGAFSRPPTAAELAACQAYLQRQLGASTGTDAPGEQMAAWSDLAHVLVNAKEFIFVQ